MRSAFCRDPMNAFEVHRKRRPEQKTGKRAVLGRNQYDSELSDSFVSEREIDDAPAVAEHMIDVLRRRFLSRHAEEPVAFRGLLIDENNHPAVANFFETFFDI